MGAKCPNINSNEWQALVERVGEDYAWGIYTLYDDIPLIAEDVDAELVKLGLRNQQGEDLLKTKDLSEKLNKRYLNLSFVAEKVGNRFSHTVTEDYIPPKEEIEAIVESLNNGTPNMSEELSMEQGILDSDMETEEPVLDSNIFDPNTKEINTYLDQLETTNTTLPFNSNMSAAYKSYETSVGSIVDARNALAQVLSPETKTHIDENVADLVGQVFYTAVPERALNSFIDNYNLRANFVNESNEPLGHSELVTEFLKYTPTTQVSAIIKRQLDLLNSVSEYLNQVSNTQSIIQDTLATIQEYKQSVPVVEQTPENVVTNTNPQRQEQVAELFESDPELANKVYEAYGFTEQVTPQQKQQAQELYSQYLSTIFPNSQVQDIVYHGSSETNLEEFNLTDFTRTSLTDSIGRKAAYFTNQKSVASTYVGSKDLGKKTIWTNLLMTIEGVKDPYGDVMLPPVSPKEILKHIKLINGKVTEIDEYFTEEDTPLILPQEKEDSKKYINLLENNDIEGIRKEANKYSDEEGNIYSVILNITNPFITRSTSGNITELDILDGRTSYNTKEYKTKLKQSLKNRDALIVTNIKDAATDYRSKKYKYPYNSKIKETTYAVFDANQIYILGSQQDIQGFENYLQQGSVLQSDNDIINSEAFQRFNEENQFTTLEENLDYYKRCKL